MDSEFTPCDLDDALQDLAKSVGILLHGVPRDQLAIFPRFHSPKSREEAWPRFIEESLRPIQTAVFQAYQAATANRLEDIVDIPCPQPLSLAAQDLAQTILLNSSGARHERLLSRLAKASSTQIHPCVALAVRAAAFNEPVVAAQVAYFYQEWQAAGADFETSPLLNFLERQPDALLTLSPTLLADSQSPFLTASKPQDQQHHG